MNSVAPIQLSFKHKILSIIFLSSSQAVWHQLQLHNNRQIVSSLSFCQTMCSKLLYFIFCNIVHLSKHTNCLPEQLKDLTSQDEPATMASRIEQSTHSRAIRREPWRCFFFYFKLCLLSFTKQLFFLIALDLLTIKELYQYTY